MRGAVAVVLVVLASACAGSAARPPDRPTGPPPCIIGDRPGPAVPHVTLVEMLAVRDGTDRVARVRIKSAYAPTCPPCYPAEGQTCTPCLPSQLVVESTDGPPATVEIDGPSDMYRLDAGTEVLVFGREGGHTALFVSGCLRLDPVCSAARW